ncbi:hypothetical protein [Streptomyces meridianus]|uniref:Uncharacterized protein n=1 Tax=Streptomyces meridianus TaxID=2938945 RepID=A0ABT0XB00_9ACTN|nr:hypothetical protein [Streptomyces meridianus]MCM2579687.1 hypothetical protein [Streptomyces meridianus]
MYDPDSPQRLASYAAVLAGALPGIWTSTHHLPEQKNNLAQLVDRVWDMDLVAESLAQHSPGQAAILTRSDGTQLVLLERHDEHDGFLIAGIAPGELPDEAYRGIREPNGIVLTDDPILSAEQVTGDLLARFDIALAQVRRTAVAAVQPSQPERVVLTWQEDGSLAAAPVGETAAAVLAANGFVPDAVGIYRLSGDDTTTQAHAVRASGQQLDVHGIATTLQHPSGRFAPSATPATPSAPAARHASPTRAR